MFKSERNYFARVYNISSFVQIMELVVDGSNYFETYEDLLQHLLFAQETKNKLE